MDKPIYLLITWIFPSPTSWRGAFAYDYAKAIERDGRYRLVVFQAGPSYEIDGIRVHGFKTHHAPSGIPFPPFWWLNRKLFARAVRAAGIDPKEVAVVDAFANGLVNEALAVKRLNPAAKLLTHHHDPASFGISVGRFRHFYPFKLINFFRMRKLQEAVDVHVFISEAVKRSFLSFPDTSWTCFDDYRRISRGLHGFRPVRIKNGYVLHNGVDTSIFKEEGRRKKEEVWTDSNPFVIGCIGNFVGWKDQETLIRAMGMVAGGGESRDERVGGGRRGASFSTGEDEAPLGSNWYDVAEDVIRELKSIRIILADAALCDRRAVKDVFKSFGLVENAFDGRKVSFPSKSVGKMLGQRGIDLYRVAGSFAEIFRSSRRAWSETEAMIENHKEHRNIGAYHQYIAKFNDGREEWLVRFTVREERGGRIARNEVHSSTVSRITVCKAKGVELSNLGHAQAEDSTPFVDNKIAYYLARVNGVEDGKRGGGEGRSLKVVFVGSGPMLERCKRLAADIESKVNQSTLQLQLPTSTKLAFTFLPEVRHEQLADFYRSLDLFVLPSYFEGFGCVFSEAWACGTPFITCEGQGMDDLIRDEDRGLWLAKPRNPDDLARKISHFIENRPEQRLKGEVDIGKLVPEFLKKICGVDLNVI